MTDDAEPVPPTEAVPPTEPALPPAALTRRRFLAVGAVGAVGVVAVAGGVWSRAAGRDPSPFVAVFGERTPAVEALGRAAIGAGVVPDDPTAVADRLPPGTVVARSSGPTGDFEVPDPAALVGGVQTASAGELAVGDLVVVEGYPLTPTEAALCAACAMAVR